MNKKDRAKLKTSWFMSSLSGCIYSVGLMLFYVSAYGFVIVVIGTFGIIYSAALMVSVFQDEQKRKAGKGKDRKRRD